MNPDELRQIVVLKAIDAASLTRLASTLEEQEYADGQMLFAQGDPGDAMYFVVSGHVRVEMRTDNVGSACKTMAFLGAGDYLGEMSLFDQKPRSAAAVAAGPTRLLRLSKAGFDALMSRSSEAAMSVVFGMIRTSSDRIRRLSSQLIVYDEIGKAIGESTNLPQLLDVVLRQLRLATFADWGLLLLKSQFSGGLELRSVEGLELSAVQKAMLGAGQGFLAPLMQEPRDLVASDLDAEEPFKSCARLGFELPALLVAPILVDQRLMGIIALGDHERGQFDLNDVNLVRGVARQAGQAIVNALHREEEAARSRHSRQYVRF